MTGTRILIVEDERAVARGLEYALSKEGFAVLWADSGRRALELVRKEDPRLVLLDIRLPDIDGYEVARRLRSDRRTSEVPIIFLTEKRDRSDRLLGLELGADDYITKPFDVQELRLRVRNSLKRLSQGSLTNPVTGLPEGALVDERLSEIITQDGSSSVLFVSIENMDSFREAYGFVASDDVLRAISLMIVNTMREVSRPEDFLGHLSGTDFILVLPASNLAALSDKLRSRLEQSIEYFYPIKDRDQVAKRKDRLMTKVVEVKDQFSTAEQARAELARLKK